jgi:dihydroneopterin aldolase
MPHTRLSLEDVVYFVRLGCSEAEREIPQEVRVKVSIDFAQAPQACRSDLLEDSVCYAQINETLEKICAEKAYATVEHLCQSCWEALMPLLAAGDELGLTLHKVHPPIGRPLKGAYFEIRGRK